MIDKIARYALYSIMVAGIAWYLLSNGIPLYGVLGLFFAYFIAFRVVLP